MARSEEDRGLDDEAAEDRLARRARLEFEDDEEASRAGERTRQSRRDPDDAEQVRRTGLTGAAFPGEGPTDDDLSPETLIHEDGARSPEEPGSGPPVDQLAEVTDIHRIGAGTGQDEAELAHSQPLDGKPWGKQPPEREDSR